jgi:hypothetical protein
VECGQFRGKGDVFQNIQNWVAVLKLLKLVAEPLFPGRGLIDSQWSVWKEGLFAKPVLKDVIQKIQNWWPVACI